MLWDEHILSNWDLLTWCKPRFNSLAWIWLFFFLLTGRYFFLKKIKMLLKKKKKLSNVLILVIGIIYVFNFFVKFVVQLCNVHSAVYMHWENKNCNIVVIILMMHSTWIFMLKIVWSYSTGWICMVFGLEFAYYLPCIKHTKKEITYGLLKHKRDDHKTTTTD